MQYNSVTKVLVESTAEMKAIAEQIDKLQIKLHQLDAIASANQPLVGELEMAMKTLGEKEDLISGTLLSLVKRREKVFTIWTGIHDTLQKSDK